MPPQSSTSGGVDPPVPAHAAFATAWHGPRDPFDQWVRAVTAEFERTQHTRSPLGLNGAALETGATQAEIAAVIRLGSLDDDPLRQIAERLPPATIWLDLGEAPPERVKAVLDALGGRAKGERASTVLARAFPPADGNAKYDRLSRLSGESLQVMARRAADYEQLRPKDRSFLYTLGRQVKQGRPMSAPQLAYLEGVLESLFSAGILKNGSGEDDSKACEEISRALSGGDEAV